MLNENTALSVFTESETRRTVRAFLHGAFSWFDVVDPIVVEQQIRQTRVFYTCRRASRGSLDATFLECRLHFDSSEMWIGRLQVSVAHRMQGLGGELVRVAERIAAGMEMREINVVPLSGSVDFWRKMGYTTKPLTARVLCKHVASSSSIDTLSNQRR